MSKFIVYLICSVFFAALGQASASGDSGFVKLEQVVVMPNGAIRITPKSGYNFANPDSCPNTGMIIMDKSNARFTAHPDSFDRIYSAVLTALTTQSNISFWLSGCVAGPGGSSVPDVFSASFRAG